MIAKPRAASCCSYAVTDCSSLGSTTGGITAATSSGTPAAMATAASTAAAGSAASCVSTTTVSGPLAPSPKFAAIRS